MRWGDFREYFRGFAWKRLTPHEVDPAVSNGHEFQGVGRLKEILGADTAERLPATYFLLHDEPEEPDVLSLWAKWYDARANTPSRSSEWRLYYPAAAGEIQSRMKAGDLMVLAVTQERKLMILLASAGSERERQLQLLFGIAEDEAGSFRVRTLDEPVALDFVTVSILDQLGLGDVHAPDGTDADVVMNLVREIVEQYGNRLPSGDTIATLIRSRLRNVDPVDSPDDALYRWIEAEAAMFRGWEDVKISSRIRQGFTLSGEEPDVAGFRQFSMSIRQSRVSRAGGALQYHFQALLNARSLTHAMEPTIDHGEIPDFVFPSLEAYLDPQFPDDKLRMLGAKFTAKDRWRQVLAEAKRVKNKHLLTLEAAISAKQMFLMTDNRLTLVIPAPIRDRYPMPQAKDILTVREFLDSLASIQDSLR